MVASVSEKKNQVKPQIPACAILKEFGTVSDTNMNKLSQLVHDHGGSNIIQRVLLANNGIAAVKEMRSIRKWAFETFEDDRTIEFIAMCTPEDMASNAEFIKMADCVVKVPGGTNNNNYANVDLIVKIAVEHHVQAVWAGWGHASENPTLPEKLSKCQPPIAFIGPKAKAMRALGDKISSTIIAQSLGIPVIPWSGSGIIMNPELCFDESACIPIYERAYVKTFEEVQTKAAQIGYPLMIKASEGGGGKGIRKALKPADLKLSFEQVQREVPGSPIFLMKLSDNCRHLEIQVVADQHGSVTTLFGRDCSVQRRHQKIIEEAPISVIGRTICEQMESDAVKLAKSVAYENVGTVEFLFDLNTNSYYFLELNPRLQVEHPTTEIISKVNIPAVQLQIAMGIPLHRIGDIRRLFSQDLYQANEFEFDAKARNIPCGHVVAARITAENPDAGFKPNGGKLHEINFKGFPGVWGYFSVGSHSGLHEYADSQFGHVFAHGESREMARKNMVMALKEMTIRGEFRTTVEYLIELLQTQDFVSNSFNTSWLDLLISNHAISSQIERATAVLCGCATIAMAVYARNESEVLAALRQRSIPNPTLLANDLNLQFIYDKVSYNCKVYRSAPHMLYIVFNSRDSAQISCTTLEDEGLLIGADGHSHVTYFRREGADYRVTIDGKTCIFESEIDPSNIKSPSPGKLVRYLVEEGSHVAQGTPVAEIEVMKMYIPLLSSEAGIIRFTKPTGSSIDTGDSIASLTLDNPDSKTRTESYAGGLFASFKSATIHPSLLELDLSLTHILTGHVCPDYRAIISQFFERFKNSSEFVDFLTLQVSNFTGRIDPLLESKLRQCLASGTEHAAMFSTFLESTEYLKPEPGSLRELLQQLFPDGKPSCDSFRLALIVRVIKLYWQIERAFHGDVTAESVYANLGEFFKSETDLAACFRSHYNLKHKNYAFSLFLETLLKNPTWGHQLIQNPLVEDALKQLTIFSGPKYFSVVHATRDLILQSKSISPVVLHQQLEHKLTNAFKNEEDRQLLDDMILGRFASMDSVPKLFMHPRNEFRNWALEAYIRRIFQPYDILTMKTFELPLCRNMFCWSYVGQNVTSGGPIIENSSDPDLSAEEIRLGFIGVFLKGLGNDSEYLQEIVTTCWPDGQDQKRRKVLYFILPESEIAEMEEDALVNKLKEPLVAMKDWLIERGIRRITYAINRSHLISLNYFTFRSVSGFHEDKNIRNVEPALAYLLELKRITDNHEVSLKYADPEGQVHIYHATEKQPNECVAKDQVVQKMFVRLLIRPNQMMREHRTMIQFFPAARAILEQMFETMEAVMAKETWIPRVHDQFVASNHLFINIIAVFFHTGEEVALVLEHLMRHYDERFNRLGIRSAEVLMNLVEGEDGSMVDLRKSREYVSKCQRVRFFFENSLGLVNATDMDAYRETRVDGKYKLECFYGRPKYELSDSYFSYSACKDIELRRNRVLKLGSTYIYDFPQIFEHILAEIWRGEKSIRSGPNGLQNQEKLIQFKEMRLDDTKSDAFGLEIINDIRSGDEESRIGMVSWLVKFKSPEYPQGREFVLIGNDLDFEIGSFGVREDDLFYRASEYARKHRIPRIYIAANSGAKFGLATELLDLIKVQWIDDADHSKGFECLYFDEETMQNNSGKLCDFVRVKESENRCGERIYEITAIIGEKEGLGVENLRGSGLIAGATSRAYQETFTLTYVTGRAVGIGAYLVRLGQRTIQRKDAPIILTGCNALNGILGRDVYLSNLQIGGPHIMAQNGISHRVVGNDFEGVREIFRWLSYIPANGFESIQDMAVPRVFAADLTDRDVNIGLNAMEMDPRILLTGANGHSGFLDSGSFTECWESWAKSVIVGRGKLGGLPVGIISTESRATELNVPSDPGRLDGAACFAPVRRAGQVWYSDSAWKTAAALKDFRTEGIPVIIFANWRGFSGGPGDLFDGILQFGSMIVDELVAARQPIFIYLPEQAELRGGSWVVLESLINEQGLVEMYADPRARAGVMEPEGIVAIKFRKREVTRLMANLESAPPHGDDRSLDGVYHQIAVKFADLHDTAERMQAKGVIRQTVTVRDSRRFFYTRLVRRLMEESLVSKEECLRTVILERVLPEIYSIIQHQGDCSVGSAYGTASDYAIVEFWKTHGPAIRAHVASYVRQYHVQRLKAELAKYESG